MPSLNDIRQRIEVVRYDPPAVGYKQMGVVIIALVLFAAGAFFAGKKVERQWWRTEIAARSAAVKSIMGQLDQEAPDFDERLIKEWSRENVEPLRAAERRLHEAQNRPPAATEPSCLLPARCLQ